MTAILHPIIFCRLVRYHLASGLTLSNSVASAAANIKRTTI